MSNIFTKNIEALKIKNPILAENIVKHIPTEIPKLVKENGFYNILYKEKLVHNPINPLAEAQEIFSKAKNSPASIHFIYGLGLGYLFQVVSKNSVGTVILYEPDLNLLRLIFELVDFSEDILKKNVYITSNLEQVSEILYKNSNTENFPEMLSLPSQSKDNEEEFKQLVKTMQDIVGQFTLDRNFTKERLYLLFKMTLQNFKSILNETPLIKYKDIYKGKTALLISAGPSLDRDIEIIKKYRDRVVIFAVGTVLKTLIANEIKPDFVSIIETYDSSKQLEGIDLSDIYFITEPSAHPNIRNHNFKQTFLHISANTPVNHFLAEVLEEDISEYWSKGTVSYTILNCARLLGCSKIVLSGQDLAYVNGQCYSKDSAYKDLVCEFNTESKTWEIKAKDFESFSNAISSSENKEERENAARIRLERLQNALYYVEGINGEKIPTEVVYASFVKLLTEYTTQFKDRIYINTSLIGAQINGFENMPLEDALKDSPVVGEISLDTDFQYDFEKIYKNLDNKLTELKKSENLINEGKQSLKNLNNNLTRYKSVNEEVLKSLRKAVENFNTLSVDFIKQSEIFEYITISDKIDIDYKMKTLRDFNYTNVFELYKNLLSYYQNAENRIKEVEGLVNESLNTKG